MPNLSPSLLPPPSLGLPSCPPPSSLLLPSPSRVSCEPPFGLEKENWTVSTLGSLSGIFDIESPEEDDDLLVPSTQRPLSAAMTVVNANANADVDPRELAAAAAAAETEGQKPTPLRLVMQKRPAVTQLRSCSAPFQAFLNEQALAEVVDPSLAGPAAAAAAPGDKADFSLFSAMEVDPALLTPPPAAAPATNPLLLDWMNQSLSSDEFGDLLQEFDREAGSSSSSSSFPSFFPLSTSGQHDLCTTVDVSQVTFESLLASQQELEEQKPQEPAFVAEVAAPAAASKPFPLPLPASVSAFALPTAPTFSEALAPKKRGRPPKSAPATLQTTPRKPAAEKKREVSPVTPFSPAPSTPCTPSGPLSKPNPDDKEAYDRYLRYRRSNNDAAHKSRLRRKEREKFNAEMVSTLQDQNVDLKRELALLRSEFQQLQGMLDAHLQQQAKAKSN